MRTGPCYWRFKGEMPWRYGYCTEAGAGLYRMGAYNGDTCGGVLVDRIDVEVKY